MLLTLEVCPLITLSWVPGKHSLAVHLIIHPLALIFAAVSELHSSSAVSFVSFQLSGIVFPIIIKEGAFSFLAGFEASLENGGVRVCLLALALLLGLDPFSFVSCSSCWLECAWTMGLIISPLTDIIIGIVAMVEPSFAFKHIVFEFPGIVGLIRIVKLAVAFLLPFEPLPEVIASFGYFVGCFIEMYLRNK